MPELDPDLIEGALALVPSINRSLDRIAEALESINVRPREPESGEAHPAIIDAVISTVIAKHASTCLDDETEVEVFKEALVAELTLRFVIIKSAGTEDSSLEHTE